MNRVREERARQIQDSINEILQRDWDPIGVKGVPECKDEYAAYVGGVYRLLVGGASAQAIAQHLSDIEHSAIGNETPADRLLPVATRLKALDVRLEAPSA